MWYSCRGEELHVVGQKLHVVQLYRLPYSSLLHMYILGSSPAAAGLLEAYGF